VFERYVHLVTNQASPAERDDAPAVSTRIRGTPIGQLKQTLPAGEWYAALPKTPTSADLVIRDPDGRILFCRTTYRATWWVIGGVAEPQESPAACARREGLEELGIELRLGRPLVVHHQVRPNLQMLSFAFDGGVIDADLTRLALDPDEIRKVAWFAPDRLPADLTPWHARRYRAAIDALADGTTAYLEDVAADPDRE
jgi:ADP-ribose pyrophosphatase YjhB (NUDIX family)